MGWGVGWLDEGLSTAICMELRATAEDSNAFALCVSEMKNRAIDVTVLAKQQSGSGEGRIE